MFEELKEVNYLRLLIIILITGLISYSLIPWAIIFPTETAVNETKIIIQKEYVIVTVTPVPDGKVYFANEYDPGTRKLARPFSWIYKNASGYKDLKVTVLVYNYLIFDSYHWFNPSDYKYYEEFPEIQNNKFLFIFVNLYIDDIIGDDNQLWLFNKDNFIVEYDYKTIHYKEYPEQIRIKELEGTYNLNDDARIEAFGQSMKYSRSSEYAKSAGEYSMKEGFLKSGLSNSLDGYILYEIPSSALPKDIIVTGKFYNFGQSSWKLKV